MVLKPDKHIIIIGQGPVARHAILRDRVDGTAFWTAKPLCPPSSWQVLELLALGAGAPPTRESAIA